jgi:CBS domain containing-hemolysin-like protein
LPDAAHQPADAADQAGRLAGAADAAHQPAGAADQAGRLAGYLHILDAVGGHPAGAPLPVRPLPQVTAGTTLADVLATMRASRSQLVAVTDPAGAALGVATLDDVLSTLLHPAPH